MKKIFEFLNDNVYRIQSLLLALAALVNYDNGAFWLLLALSIGIMGIGEVVEQLKKLNKK